MSFRTLKARREDSGERSVGNLGASTRDLWALAAVIGAAIRPGQVVRLAVDGVDGADRRVFADEFADMLHQHPGSR